jgi:hypothetical protein
MLNHQLKVPKVLKLLQLMLLQLKNQKLRRMMPSLMTPKKTLSTELLQKVRCAAAAFATAQDQRLSISHVSVASQSNAVLSLLEF